MLHKVGFGGFNGAILQNMPKNVIFRGFLRISRQGKVLGMGTWGIFGFSVKFPIGIAHKIILSSQIPISDYCATRVVEHTFMRSAVGGCANFRVQSNFPGAAVVSLGKTNHGCKHLGCYPPCSALPRQI